MQPIPFKTHDGQRLSLADLSRLGLTYAQQLIVEGGATLYLPDAVRLQIKVRRHMFDSNQHANGGNR